MSIVRVFFNPLDAKSEERFDIDAGLKIIDFLVQEFPSGFNAPVRVFVGHEELEADDWDYVIKDDERITVLVSPAWAAVGGYVINALIAVAIGLVIGLIFKPKTPGGISDDDESPVYSIGATKNAARLGAPVEVSYGTVNWPPSYGAAPYIFNSTNSVGGNDQFVDELLCLGHGDYEILDVTVGNTSVNDLSPSTFKYWIFGPEDHKQTLGQIEKLVDQQTNGTENPLPWYENVTTSPEVQDITFADTTTPISVAPAPISGSAVPPSSGSLGSLINVPSSIDVVAGDVLTLTLSDFNNITFTVDSVVVDELTPTVMSIFQTANSTPFTTETPLNALTEYEVNVAPVTAKKFGPFRAQRDGQNITMIWCDFIWPQGLYSRDGTDGDIKSAGVELGFSYQQINPETGVAIGAPVTRTDLYRNSTLSPYRRSTRSPELTPGAYEVTVERRNDFDDERTTDLTQWVGLRGVVELDPTQVVYGPDVTMMAIRMRATAGLGQAARERVRVTARRKLGDDTENSANPIVVIEDIYTNEIYGLGRPEAELDLVTLDQLKADWIGDAAPRFNGSFDSKSTGFDGMESVCALAASRLVSDGGLLTVVPDRIQDVRAALFSSANTNNLSILYNFDTFQEFNGIQIEYRDINNNFDAAYVYYNPEGDSIPTNPDTITLHGCTSELYAKQMASYYWNIKGRRRKEITLTTELEGLIPRFGDRIGVSTPLASWGQSGVFVREIDPQTWIVDQDLDWTTSNVLVIRTELGTGSQQYSVTEGTAPNIVVFGITPTETIAPADDREPSNYIFGTATDLLRDFMVTKTTPKTDIEVEIVGQTYDQLIYEEGDPQPPPHMRNETGYLCSAYEQGLLTSALTDVWLMNDNPGAGEDPPNLKGTLTLTNNLNMNTDGPGLLADPCSTEYSYEFLDPGYLRGNNVPTTKALTFTWLQGPSGNNRIIDYDFVLQFGVQVGWGGAGFPGSGAGNNDLVVRVISRASPSDPIVTEDVIFPDVMNTTGNSVFIVMWQDNVTLPVPIPGYIALYKDFEFAGLGYVNGSVSNHDYGVGPGLDIGGGTNTLWDGSHVGFADFSLVDFNAVPIDESNVKYLANAFARNQDGN